ncbi:farnesyl cysteine-carboxyl methyltransferase [Vermiconidia calcicola]|uniref:Farnesyl cysteine-carboxyl methyltransferase n=1 Tax=Vermiconidia calcicola TaxID=1690605 RepID=A0ACC3MJY5_9PEZI|nr:farnesyl cysteine-carboxyl methyltransferase [Vermiconidia calcicola]
MARKSTTSSTANINGHLPTTAEVDPQLGKKIIPGTNREDTDDEFDWESPQYAIKTQTLPYDPSLLPKGSRSLSFIGLQAFVLGFTLAICILVAAWLANEGRTTWRLPAFFACLSLFHFLEYWTTAHFNMPATRASSFLLYSNGAAYNTAHALAAVEIVVSNALPWYQRLFVNFYTITAGLVLVAMGQIIRSVAMAQAGTNFSHTPAKTRKEGHELVTAGIYSLLRHPSYFGFFWWALGTQVLVGNKVCFLGYLFILWNFFRRRIKAEEITLIDFFGKDYEQFRRRTGTGIPFIC